MEEQLAGLEAKHSCLQEEKETHFLETKNVPRLIYWGHNKRHQKKKHPENDVGQVGGDGDISSQMIELVIHNY